MKQQQIQMEELHAEQQRIQGMLVQQRQQQWGQPERTGVRWQALTFKSDRGGGYVKQFIIQNEVRNI